MCAPCKDEHQVKVDIQEDGLVYVAGESGAEVMQALEKIKSMVEEPEIGHIYTGTVKRVESYGRLRRISARLRRHGARLTIG